MFGSDNLGGGMFGEGNDPYRGYKNKIDQQYVKALTLQSFIYSFDHLAVATLLRGIALESKQGSEKVQQIFEVWKQEIERQIGEELKKQSAETDKLKEELKSSPLYTVLGLDKYIDELDNTTEIHIYLDEVMSLAEDYIRKSIFGEDAGLEE